MWVNGWLAGWMNETFWIVCSSVNSYILKGILDMRFHTCQQLENSVSTELEKCESEEMNDGGREERERRESVTCI